MTAPFLYIRFHSGEVMGNSCYTDKELAKWATRIREWLKEYDLYIYFNNDASGYAIANAKKLRHYLTTNTL